MVSQIEKRRCTLEHTLLFVNAVCFVRRIHKTELLIEAVASIYIEILILHIDAFGALLFVYLQATTNGTANVIMTAAWSVGQTPVEA